MRHILRLYFDLLGRYKRYFKEERGAIAYHRHEQINAIRNSIKTLIGSNLVSTQLETQALLVLPTEEDELVTFVRLHLGLNDDYSTQFTVYGNSARKLKGDLRRRRSRRTYYTQTFENEFKADSALFSETLPTDKLSEASDDLDKTEQMLHREENVVVQDQ